MLEFITGQSTGAGILPMMGLGYFVFNVHTVPYQSQQHDMTWRHPTNSRVGARPASQFIGPGEETMTLSGVLVPEITGGRISLDLLRKMADTGKAYPLIEGTGIFHGLFVIESIITTKTELFSDGAARRIEFSMKLNRADENDRGLLGVLDVGGIDFGSTLGGQLS